MLRNSTILRAKLKNYGGATSGAGTAYPSGTPKSTPGFQWGSCYSIISCMCMFCISLFVLLYFFFWPLCCLFFFDLWILITSLWYLQTLLRYLRLYQYHWINTYTDGLLPSRGYHLPVVSLGTVMVYQIYLLLKSTVPK